MFLVYYKCRLQIIWLYKFPPEKLCMHLIIFKIQKCPNDEKIFQNWWCFWPHSENWNRVVPKNETRRPFPPRWNPSSKYGQILIWISSWLSLSWYYHVQRCHALFFNLHKLQSGYNCYILKEYVKGSISSVITRLIWNHEHDAWNWLDVA